MIIIEFNVYFVLILSFALGMQCGCAYTNYLLFILQHKKVLIITYFHLPLFCRSYDSILFKRIVHGICVLKMTLFFVIKINKTIIL